VGALAIIQVVLDRLDTWLLRWRPAREGTT
jgi:hypothetical protein